MRRLTLLTPLAACLCLFVSCSSWSPDPADVAPRPAQQTVIDPSQSEITAAAEREIIRRQQALHRADEAFLRGQHQMADGDYEGAMGSTRQALGE